MGTIASNCDDYYAICRNWLAIGNLPHLAWINVTEFISNKRSPAPVAVTIDLHMQLLSE